MEEFWVCQHCRSLNRAGSGKCYSCRQKYGSKPKEPPAIVKAAGSPPPQIPFNPAGPSAAIGADEPAYLSRPVALAPAPARSFTETAAEAARSKRRLKLPSPAGWVRRRIGWWFAARPFVPVWFFGYAAAALLAAMLVVAALLVSSAGPIWRSALQTGSLTTALDQFDAGQRSGLQSLATIFAVVAGLELVFLSLFMGISTHNAPGLGTDNPLLTPAGAATCWWAGLRAQALIGIGLLGPAVSIYLGYPIPGLIVAVIAVEIGQRRLDEPFRWIMNPARHLPDLYSKLGVTGSDWSILAFAWSVCFRVANVLTILLFSLPIIVVGLIAASNVSGRSEFLVWQGSGFAPVQMGLLALVVPWLFTTSFALGLMVPLIVEMVERQKTRQTLVRVGRSRSWVAHPGNYNAPAQDGPARYDPYDGSYVRTNTDEDQASLYSPSTTSSSAWDEDGSSEPAG